MWYAIEATIAHKCLGERPEDEVLVEAPNAVEALEKLVLLAYRVKNVTQVRVTIRPVPEGPTAGY